jgi:hypothetical protein
MNGIAYPDQTYGALQEGLFLARFTLDRAFKSHLEPLIEGDAWRGCGPGFDDINVFMDSLRLDKFRTIASERQAIVRRIKELQPDVSNRQIARTFGVAEGTVRNDVAQNYAGSGKTGNGNNGAQEGGAQNYAGFRTEFSGNKEWYTPSDYIERARRVLGVIDLDPASSEFAQKRRGRFVTPARSRVCGRQGRPSQRRRNNRRALDHVADMDADAEFDAQFPAQSSAASVGRVRAILPSPFGLCLHLPSPCPHPKRPMFSYEKDRGEGSEGFLKLSHHAHVTF